MLCSKCLVPMIPFQWGRGFEVYRELGPNPSKRDLERVHERQGTLVSGFGYPECRGLVEIV